MLKSTKIYVQKDFIDKRIVFIDKGGQHKQL